ncbi:NAD(P)-binding domain containing protein [Trema orientale]|uniref:NAD(P)-binding domain containing protein n=1 Tax=Trema orientale TaxID=63057 RepID=A0A2P5ERY4_TREOI|nr:NAD(P)-binding domain containing protein [Trema orientale]
MGTIVVGFTNAIGPQGLVGHLRILPCSSWYFASKTSRTLLETPNFSPKKATLSSLSSSMATPLQVSASSTIGAPDEELKVSSSRLVGENDLLIVGPGVLGRLVAQKWREEHPGYQIYGQTVTTDHHEELIELGINPSLKGTEVTNKFPYVIFCAPPSRSSDYPGDVREAGLSWTGDGSFLFTSSSAPYDRNDNGPCDEDTPVVPIGRSPRTDVLLKAEKVVLEFGGCVVRLGGLYISFVQSIYEDYM